MAKAIPYARNVWRKATCRGCVDIWVSATWKSLLENGLSRCRRGANLACGLGFHFASDWQQMCRGICAHGNLRDLGAQHRVLGFVMGYSGVLVIDCRRYEGDRRCKRPSSSVVGRILDLKRTLWFNYEARDEC